MTTKTKKRIAWEGLLFAGYLTITCSIIIPMSRIRVSYTRQGIRNLNIFAYYLVISLVIYTGIRFIIWAIKILELKINKSKVIGTIILIAKQVIIICGIMLLFTISEGLFRRTCGYSNGLAFYLLPTLPLGLTIWSVINKIILFGAYPIYLLICLIKTLRKK